ncbi:MAG TPA: hypothetical protein VID72_07765 [Ktedonobacterales bacterium]|jgi:hypothetical protein
MAQYHQCKLGRAHISARQRARGPLNHFQHASQRDADGGAGVRARVIASLVAASHALSADADAAALLLDGALSQLLDLWASYAHVHLADRRQALAALDDHAPAIAWRVRLALQAHQPEARLAHCWALLELLTRPTPLTIGIAKSAQCAPAHSAQRHVRHPAKDGDSYVS